VYDALHWASSAEEESETLTVASLAEIPEEDTLTDSDTDLENGSQMPSWEPVLRRNANIYQAPEQAIVDVIDIHHPSVHFTRPVLHRMGG
jgi:hypothetical protein